MAKKQHLNGVVHVENDTISHLENQIKNSLEHYPNFQNHIAQMDGILFLMIS